MTATPRAADSRFARRLAQGGPWDAFATTFGTEDADTIRRFVERLPTTVDRSAVEHALLRSKLRREARTKIGPIERRDVEEAIRSVAHSVRRLKRDFPLLAFGSGLDDAITNVREMAKVLLRPQGRPAWRKELLRELLTLGLLRVDAHKLADLVKPA